MYRLLNNQQELSKLMLQSAGNITLVFTAVYCAFGALVSAFSMTISMTTLFWIFLFTSAVVSVIAMNFRVKGLLLLFIPVALYILIYLTGIIDSAMWVTNEIIDQYGNWLPVKGPFPEIEDYTGNGADFIVTVGIIVTFLLGYSICLRRSVFINIVFTAPFVFLTFVVTDLYSDMIYLFGLIAVYLAILFSSLISPDDFKKRGIVLLPSFAVAVIFMMIAYILAPSGSYSRDEGIANLGNRFRYYASQMGRFGRLWQTYGDGIAVGWLVSLDGGFTWQFNTDVVSITDAGRRQLSNHNLLEIKVNEPGTFYLRGYSMHNFDGASWTSSVPLTGLTSDRNARSRPALIGEIYSYIENFQGPPLMEMYINRTGDYTFDISYEPYYGIYHSDDIEVLENSEVFRYIPEGVHRMLEVIEEYGDLYDLIHVPEMEHEFITERYTQIDRETTVMLRERAARAGINPYAARTVVADAVARYISSSADYTLSPAGIPPDEDFVNYFLDVSQEGYCIHFTTVAVLMLRALDIPARFTCGYVVTVSPEDVGRNIVITERNAHAWVEVYYEDAGWLYLEVTPGGGGTLIPERRPHSPQQFGTIDNPYPDIPDFNIDDYLNREQNEPDDTDETVGGGGGTRPDEGLNIFVMVLRIVGIVLGVAVVIASFPIRRKLTIDYRMKKFNQADTNKAAIYIWRYIKQITPRRYSPPGSIESIALKARYSQHRLTRDECKEMIKYTEKLKTDVYESMDNIERLWAKYIRALL